MIEHEIQENLKVLESIIDDGKTKTKVEKEDLELFKLSHQFIKSRLNLCAPSLVQDSDLTNAASDLDQAITHLNNFLGDEEEGQLVNSKSKLRTAVNRIKTLPVLISGESFDFSTEIKTFRKTLSTENEKYRSELDALQNRIADLNQLLEERQKELDEITACIDVKQTEIDALNSAFEDKYEADRAANQNRIEELLGRFNEQTASTVADLEKKKEEASKIVNVIGNIGATGNFQKIANDHKKDANVWRYIAIVLMGGLSILVIWTIIGLGSDEFDWTKSLVRILAAAVLSYPATYAARESAKHRKLENYNRKLELELSSIESFIELLPEEKKQDIKEKLADKYFGSTLDLFDDHDLKSDKEYSLQGIERLFKALEPLLKK